jgi:hypothetical protein
MRNQCWLKSLFPAFVLPILLGSILAPTTTAGQQMPQVHLTKVGQRDHLVITGGVKEAYVIGHNFTGRKAFDSGLLNGPVIDWPLADLLPGKYLMLLTGKTVAGEGVEMAFGIVKSAKGTELKSADEIIEHASADDRAEFFQCVTGVRSQEAAGWFFYGVALYDQYHYNPPVPARGPKPIEMEIHPNKLKANFAPAANAFQKVLELSTDCQMKFNAMGFLASLYTDVGDKEKANEWETNVVAMPCATPEVKALPYFRQAVEQWQCAYGISGRYADRRKAADLFHARNFINEADKRNFETCVAKGMDLIEKALAIRPDFVDALNYKALLLREKQKATINEAERSSLDKEAKRLIERATALTKKQ